METHNIITELRGEFHGQVEGQWKMVEEMTLKACLSHEVRKKNNWGPSLTVDSIGDEHHGQTLVRGWTN